jgi:hypothetical protein
MMNLKNTANVFFFFYLPECVMIPNFDNKHIMQSILNNKVKSLIPNRIQAVVHDLHKEIKNEAKLCSAANKNHSTTEDLRSQEHEAEMQR